MKLLRRTWIIWCTRRIIFGGLAGIFLLGKAMAQDNRAGLLPSISLNQKLISKWTLNLKWESRSNWEPASNDGFEPGGLQYERSDFSLLAGWRRSARQKWVLGYLMRLSDVQLTSRTIQQFSFVQPLRQFRLAHRFATDQTFPAEKSPIFRFRYRITAELPLNGQAADPGEFYIRLNHEYLAISQQTWDIELRVVPLLGYTLSTGQKVEIGVDYRADRLLQEKVRHRAWLSLNWYVKG